MLEILSIEVLDPKTSSLVGKMESSNLLSLCFVFVGKEQQHITELLPTLPHKSISREKMDILIPLIFGC
jgi:hypothetical protein